MAVWERIGYHTTHISNREAILRDGFKVNDNEKDTWVGTGVYFWANLRDAESWSKMWYKPRRYVIFVSTIRLDRQYVLDVTTEESLVLYEEMYRELVGGQGRASAAFGDGHELDREIVKALSLRHNWKIVVYADNWNQSPRYVRGRDKGNMPRSYILDHNTRRRVTYCVRDTACIRSTTILDEVARDETAAAKDAGGY